MTHHDVLNRMTSCYVTERALQDVLQHWSSARVARVLRNIMQYSIIHYQSIVTSLHIYISVCTTIYIYIHNLSLSLSYIYIYIYTHTCNRELLPSKPHLRFVLICNCAEPADSKHTNKTTIIHTSLSLYIVCVYTYIYIYIHSILKQYTII